MQRTSAIATAVEISIAQLLPVLLMVRCKPRSWLRCRIWPRKAKSKHVSSVLTRPCDFVSTSAQRIRLDGLDPGADRRRLGVGVWSWELKLTAASGVQRDDLQPNRNRFSPPSILIVASGVPMPATAHERRRLRPKRNRRGAFLRQTDAAASHLRRRSGSVRPRGRSRI